MPFSWWTPTPPKKPFDTGARRDAMYRDELEDRASLFSRLGYSRERCKARLKANVKWDFEMRGSPRHERDIDRIVDAVYRRGGRSSGAPSV
jgi:hypothetical protein